MKTFGIISSIFVTALFFSSCHSSKEILVNMWETRGHLYYELSRPEYTGEIKQNIYLDFIGYSNMDYYTSVKKKRRLYIPLLFYNYATETFEAKLGERSLTMNYREFLTDALLAECNNSTCFNLINNADEVASPDSVYTLNVTITDNTTTGGIKLKDSSIFIIWGQDEDSSILLESEKHQLKPAVTNLKINVLLSKNRKKLFEKEYMINKAYQSTGKGWGDVYATSIGCLDRMAESLSLATKEIVEEMSGELHLLMASLKE